MKKILSSILYYVIASLIFSCQAQKSNSLSGIWIPKRIDWKEGSFHTIYIYNDTSFVRVASMQTKTKKDSINFRSEPGFIVEYGKIETTENQDRISVLYRLLYRTFKIVDEPLPGEIKKNHFHIEKDKSGKYLLLFEDEVYSLTSLYTKESQSQIKALAEKFVPQLFKEYNIHP